MSAAPFMQARRSTDLRACPGHVCLPTFLADASTLVPAPASHACILAKSSRYFVVGMESQGMRVHPFGMEQRVGPDESSGLGAYIASEDGLDGCAVVSEWHGGMVHTITRAVNRAGLWSIEEALEVIVDSTPPDAPDQLVAHVQNPSDGRIEMFPVSCSPQSHCRSTALRAKLQTTIASQLPVLLP